MAIEVDTGGSHYLDKAYLDTTLMSTLKTGPDPLPYMLFVFQQCIARTMPKSTKRVTLHKFRIPVM